MQRISLENLHGYINSRFSLNDDTSDWTSLQYYDTNDMPSHHDDTYDRISLHDDTNDTTSHHDDTNVRTSLHDYAKVRTSKDDSDAEADLLTQRDPNVVSAPKF
jgi:hypothetical protein